MAAPPVAPFRVRYGAGPFERVRLAPGMSEAGIKEAVALATGLAVGTFGLRDAEGVSGFHAGLAGDWEAVLLPGQAPPAGGAAGPGGAAGVAANSAAGAVRLSAGLDALRVDVRPSDLASKAFAVRNFIGKRASTRALDEAPDWVRARVMAGLPGDLRTPVPLAVLDPAFGALVDACEGRQLPPDPDLVVRSMTLMAASAEHFETERQRNEQILRLLRPILGVDLVKSESDDAEHPTVTDGSSFVLTQSGSRVLLANLELKDRPAAGRPELQNISYYLQHYVPRGGGGGAPRDALAAMPLLPALLIDIHGGVALSVRGVVVTGFCVLSEVLASAHLVGSPNSPQH